MLRSIGKQSWESVESVLKKKRKATEGKDLQKKGFKPGKKERHSFIAGLEPSFSANPSHRT